jgi:hypothetical protein
MSYSRCSVWTLLLILDACGRKVRMVSVEQFGSPVWGGVELSRTEDPTFDFPASPSFAVDNQRSIVTTWAHVLTTSFACAKTF